MQRYFIELAYKGTSFHGWQKQPNASSVQESIEKGIGKILGQTTYIVGAGRTDTGVHASQYFAHFDAIEIYDLPDFTYRLNAVLPDEIVIYNTLKVITDAHARFDAISREYNYKIFLGSNPFNLETTWQFLNKKPNIDLMNKAAASLLKHKDFKAFSKSNTDVRTYICDVQYAHWHLSGQELTFEIRANRFLRNMVRAIVGTLLEVGEGKITVDEFDQIIKSRDRRQAGLSVPARGLFLSGVAYPKGLFLK